MDMNGLKKKRRKISIIRFLVLSIDDYERSLSFLSEACNGIKSVDGSTKLHKLFSLLQTNCG